MRDAARRSPSFYLSIYSCACATIALKAPYASSASAVFMLRLKSGTCFLLLTSPYSVNWLTCVESKPHVAGQSHPSGWLAEVGRGWPEPWSSLRRGVI